MSLKGVGRDGRLGLVPEEEEEEDGSIVSLSMRGERRVFREGEEGGGVTLSPVARRIALPPPTFAGRSISAS